MDFTKLTPIEKMLADDEGWVNKPYQDTLGNWTVGAGRNLHTTTFTDDEILLMLQNDIARIEKQLMKFTWYNNIPELKKMVVLNMAFNLGITGLLKFEWFIDAIIKQDYKTAAVHILQSKAAQQNKNRYQRLAKLMEQ